MLARSPVSLWLSGMRLEGLSNVFEANGFDDMEFMVSSQSLICVLTIKYSQSLVLIVHHTVIGWGHFNCCRPTRDEHSRRRPEVRPHMLLHMT